MSDKCDFYCMEHDGQLNWIGSLGVNGSPFDLPPNLFLQSEYNTFEFEVLDYLEKNKGHVRFNGHPWPWQWSNSKETDYVYIFDKCSGTVLMCNYGSRVVDVIEVIRGVDMIGADVGIGTVKFPDMKVK